MLAICFNYDSEMILKFNYDVKFSNIKFIFLNVSMNYLQINKMFGLLIKHYPTNIQCA